MSYNILGINIGHNSSACLLIDGELTYYLEEERLSKKKRDGNPFRAMFDICTKYKVDELIISGTNSPAEFNTLVYTGENPYLALVRKFYPYVKVTYLNHQHHLTHALSSFYNSGFKEATCLVIDAAGSLNSSNSYSPKWESESIFKIDYPQNITEIYKNYGNTFSKIGIGRVYGAVTSYLGFHPLEGGKTMGLSSYGSFDKTTLDFFINGTGNTDFIISDPNSITDLNLGNKGNYEWHNDINKLDIAKANLAHKVQVQSQQEVKNLISKILKTTPTSNICCSGGYFLNCVTNYFLKKEFPSIDFYFEPISSDAGTSIGAAKYLWHYKTQDPTIRPLKSLYQGLQYSKEELLKGIKKYI